MFDMHLAPFFIEPDDNGVGGISETSAHFCEAVWCHTPQRFCFLNRVFRSYMREKQKNATIIHSVY
jgi:hypothetical protein